MPRKLKQYFGLMNSVSLFNLVLSDLKVLPFSHIWPCYFKIQEKKITNIKFHKF